MGRKKGYDRQELVETAMGVFHRRGFKGASTEILVKELAVNRNSVYAEFGSKEKLFSVALSEYDRQVVSHIFGPLESPDANLDDIEALYRSFLSTANDATGLGCLMCNTAAELGGSEPNLQPQVDRYFARLHNAFCNALAGAVRMKQIKCEIDVDDEAWSLTATCLGIFLMVRAGIATTAALAAVQGSLHHLLRLRETALDDRAFTLESGLPTFNLPPV